MIQAAILARTAFNRLWPKSAASAEYSRRQAVRESARLRMRAVRMQKRLLATESESGPSNSNGSKSPRIRFSGIKPGENEESPRPSHISKDGEWTAIYQFRSILPVSMISQLKIAASAWIIALGPYTAYTYYLEGSMMGVADSAGITLVAAVALLMFTNVSRRLIGVIAINKDRTLLRVGYLNFWGLRRNLIFPLEDVSTLDDVEPDIPAAMEARKAVIRFQAEGLKADLFLPIYNVEIPEPELFEVAFGRLLPPECCEKQGLSSILRRLAKVQVK